MCAMFVRRFIEQIFFLFGWSQVKGSFFLSFFFWQFSLYIKAMVEKRKWSQKRQKRMRIVMIEKGRMIVKVCVIDLECGDCQTLVHL